MSAPINGSDPAGRPAPSGMFDANRVLLDSPFPDDDGAADPAVRAALAAVGSEPTAYLRAVAALCGARLLVPVVATATRLAEVDLGADGERRVGSDKEAEMAVVLLQTADGRRALLAFTGQDSMRAWDASARPVPVTVDLAARTVVDEQAAALLVDVAGPAPLAVDGEVLGQLAAGHRLVRLDAEEFGWLGPADG